MLEGMGVSGQMRPVMLTQASLAPLCCVSAFLKALPFLSENFINLMTMKRELKIGAEMNSLDLQPP